MNKLPEVIAAQSRIENLIVRKRAMTTQNPIGVEQIKRQIIAACKAFGITNDYYPRGYHLVADTRKDDGYRLCLRGHTAQVSAEQFAFDIGTGFLDEFADFLEDKLPQQKALPAPPPGYGAQRDAETNR